MTFLSPSKCSRRRIGFTLIEILFVILVIGLLVAIALPNFIAAREQTRRKACVNNLRKIEWAKDAWLMDNNKEQNSTITADNIYPADGSGYLKAKPICDASGVYTIGRGDETPTCNYGNGHVINGLQ